MTEARRAGARPGRGDVGRGADGGPDGRAVLAVAGCYLVAWGYSPLGAQVITIAALGRAAYLALFRRRAEPSPVRMLGALHTGSVNNYAAVSARGLVFAVAVLAA